MFYYLSYFKNIKDKKDFLSKYLLKENIIILKNLFQNIFDKKSIFIEEKQRMSGELVRINFFVD